MNTPLQQAKGLVDETLRHMTQQIIRALQNIRYGSVEIIIHDFRIVQIERKEKIRIDTDSSRTTINEQADYNCTVLLSEL